MSEEGAPAGRAPARRLWQARRNQSRLAAAGATLLLAWSLYRGLAGPNRVLEVDGAVRHVAFSLDGRLFAVSLEGAVRLWDAATWSRRELALPPAPEPTPRGGPLAFSPDGRRLAVAREAPDAGGASVFVWDLARQEWAWRAPLGGAPVWLAFSPDGSRLAAAANAPAPPSRPTPGEIALFEAGAGGALDKLSGGDDAFSWVGWSADGRVLRYRKQVWSGGRYESLALAERPSQAGGAERTLHRERCPAPGTAASSPDGRLLAVADAGRESYLLVEPGGAARSIDRELLASPHPSPSFSPGAFSPDGRLYAAPASFGAAGKDRRVRIWSASSWRIVGEKPLRARGLVDPAIRSVAMSSSWLAAAYGDDLKTRIYLWNVARY
ncbi:MAG: WD40 repeat domain-containing protein [Elusimicrobia bacterium]|nr:WD40 repeat domain-containing protein [Elusimicrobiota bacterium]